MPALQTPFLSKSLDLTLSQYALQDRILVLLPSPHVLLHDDHVVHEVYSGGPKKVFVLIYLLNTFVYSRKRQVGVHLYRTIKWIFTGDMNIGRWINLILCTLDLHTLNNFFSYFFRISRKFQKCVTFKHITFTHDSVYRRTFLFVCLLEKQNW